MSPRRLYRTVICRPSADTRNVRSRPPATTHTNGSELPNRNRTPPDGTSITVDPVVNKANVASGNAANRLPDTASYMRSTSNLTPARHTLTMRSARDARAKTQITTPR